MYDSARLMGEAARSLPHAAPMKNLPPCWAVHCYLIGLNFQLDNAIPWLN